MEFLRRDLGEVGTDGVTFEETGNGTILFPDYVAAHAGVMPRRAACRIHDQVAACSMCFNQIESLTPHRIRQNTG